MEEGELAPEHEAALQDLQRVLQLLGGEELTMVAGKLSAHGWARVRRDSRPAELEVYF